MRKLVLIALVTTLGIFAHSRGPGPAREESPAKDEAKLANGLDTQSPKPLVISHVTVIDATGAAPQEDMTVVIMGNRIAQVDKTANAKIPRRAQVLEAKGKFLIPGLWDMHVHLSWTRGSALPVLVANGVTGVRDMGGSLG